MSSIKQMTPKERMTALFERRPVDVCPVIAPYIMLSDADHWEELTGLPTWKFFEWQILEPEEHVLMYGQFRQQLPFDVFQPWYGSSREHRETMEIVHREDGAYFHNKKTDMFSKVPESIHDSGSGGSANETRKVFNKEDAQAQIKSTPADKILESGSMDYVQAAARTYGQEHFIISGGVVNTFYSCSWSVGLTNLFSLLYDEPDLVRYISQRILEQNIETIRAMARAGGDAIYIDDATATKDMISAEFYEQFSLPYLSEQVKEIQRLGKRAILVYFGGVDDRLEQILSTGADGLIVEASMKGFKNDIGKFARINGNRTCLFGNLNPYDDVEKADEETLWNRMKAQYEAAMPHGRFAVSTGSPLTPGTSTARLRKYIDMGHALALTKAMNIDTIK